MALSAFDLYSVGIGPSFSHTVGPVRAARRFVGLLDEEGLLPLVSRARAELFGSLGATGRGHGSDKAVVLGLEDEDPATVDTHRADGRVALVCDSNTLLLAGKHRIGFDSDADLVLHRRKSLPAHPNGMMFHSAAELLAHCAREDLAISDIMLANEQAWRPEAEVRAGLMHLWSVMQACVERGCHREGVLPGGLRVPRRAPALFQALNSGTGDQDPLHIMDWVNLFTLAVNEENASGGRIVTAPTNGAAGIMPAVLHYYARFITGADDDGIVRFLLTAAAIGILFKENTSISGAEVGCQGEVGSACSMAAGALCEVLGGTPAQVENAAEVGIEHNLGLTCDPVGGLVQIPCIERNAIAANKAINAARLALAGDGTHKVTLDKAIKTMRDTGRDHEGQVQGNRPRRPRRQHHRMLTP